MDGPFDSLEPVPIDHDTDGYTAQQTGWNARPSHDDRAAAIDTAEACMAAADHVLDRYERDTVAAQDGHTPVTISTPEDHPWNAHTAFEERFHAYAVTFAEAADRMHHQRRELTPYDDVRTEETCLEEYAEALERQSDLAERRARRG